MKKHTTILIWICFVFATIISCKKNEIFKGSDALITISRELPSFNKIDLEDDLEVNVTQGNSQMVEITVNQNLQNQIKTTVSNNTLNVELESGSYDNEHFVVNIKIPSLERFQLNDNTRGNVNFVSDEFEFEVNGSSVLTLEGSSDILTTEINDAGRINGFSFVTEILNTSSKDASELEITCNNQLNGNVDDASEVRYRGIPKINAQTSEDGQIIDSN